MLTYLAARDPAILHTLGITAEFVKRESARAAAAAKWRSMQPEEKQAADEAAWRAWLAKYLARLGREKRAGALEEQRWVLMNRSNPRIVLRNWVRRLGLSASRRCHTCPSRVARVVPRQETCLDNHLRGGCLGAMFDSRP